MGVVGRPLADGGQEVTLRQREWNLLEGPNRIFTSTVREGGLQ